jgi:hypothetical protein
MAESETKIVAEIKKHPLPVLALAGGVGLIIWRARKSLAQGASAIPVLAGAPATVDTGSSGAVGYPSTTAPDLSGLTSSISSAFGQLQTEINSLAQSPPNPYANVPGYTAGEQQYLAGYTPATALQSSAVSAAQSAGQTLSANCNKVTSCKGFFSCFNPFRQIPALLGCAGQAVLTVGTGVAATVLPAVQTATNSLANYAPSILGAGLGIPGLPKAPAAPAASPIPYYPAPAPGVGYGYSAPYSPYTPPISPYTAAPQTVRPATPVPVAPAPTIYPIGEVSA